MNYCLKWEKLKEKTAYAQRASETTALYRSMISSINYYTIRVQYCDLFVYNYHVILVGSRNGASRTSDLERFSSSSWWSERRRDARKHMISGIIILYYVIGEKGAGP